MIKEENDISPGDFLKNIFIDNHIEQLHLQYYKKNTLTIDINRVKQN